MGRVLRLVWIMFIMYWLNLLLVVLLGLYENVSCLTLIVSSTCIVLMNDYEFGSSYWKIRGAMCDVCSDLCCICSRTYCCNDCFCGEEKVYRDNFSPLSQNGDYDAGYSKEQSSML